MEESSFHNPRPLRVGGSGRVMGECLVGQWIVGVIGFQKIFGLCGLNGHIVEKR